MENSIFTYVQIGTVLTFIGTLFVLYRVYVQQKDATISQKDATIQHLKEKIDGLQRELDTAKEASPDNLLKNLDQRIKVYAEELERLSKDKTTSEALLKEKEEELLELREGVRQATERLERFNRALINAAEAFKKV